MDNPGQHLIHFTNRGPSVLSRNTGEVGSFKVSTKQPFKDINKFGLLHYSIPKMCDHVDNTNNRFFIRFTFGDRSTVTITVTMPELDYYSMLISQEFDASTMGPGSNGRAKNVLAFDEVLQTTINWAIMHGYDSMIENNGPTNNGTGYSLGQSNLYRISCVVKRDTFGCLALYFGYRGSQIVNNNQDLNQSYRPGVQANSGNPYEHYNVCLPSGHLVNGGPNGMITLAYNPPIRAPDNWTWTGVVPNEENSRAMRLEEVEFFNVSTRMQLMLGASRDAFFTTSSAQPDRGQGVGITVTRGRIRLKNYVDPVINTIDTNILLLGFETPPCLDPPSFMYLQLDVPGTRSKILGQSDERGGWALPTQANEYVSNHMNFPGGLQYHPENVRYVPGIFDLQGYQIEFANKAPTDGIGFNFDFIPLNANGIIANTNVRRIDNYNIQHFINPNVILSPLLRIGRVDTRAIPQKPKQRYQRSSQNAYAGSLQGGFGLGPFRASSVFTVSLIEPNYVYTSVENATIQTFDVRLMWGDTSEDVVGVAANPVQFSLVASP